MKKCILAFLMPMLAAIVLVSCQKENLSTEIAEIGDELMMQQSEQHSIDDVDAASFKTQGVDTETLRRELPPCATITDSGMNSYPRTITIDYGTGCEGRHGKIKKGKIVITVSDDMVNPGAKRTLDFVDFYIEDKQLLGTKQLTNISEAGATQPLFDVEIDLELIHENKSRTKSASGTIQWVQGFDTRDDLEDDVLLRSINAAIQCSNGNTITKTAVEPVRIERACKYPVSGVVEIYNIAKDKLSQIDFGDGNCDNEATLTRDGEVRIIDLDERRLRRRRR